MNGELTKIAKMIEGLHGKEINLKDGEIHYLYFKDGVVEIYLDQDEKELKVKVEFTEEGKQFVHFAKDESLSELLGL